jgi:hypothetical protein
MAFSEEALKKFHEMCAAGLNFAEGESYDFARCIKSDGEIYGTKGQCKAGKPLGEKEKGGDSKVESRMAKLKRAFIKKMDREMTPAEIAKAMNMIGIPIPKGQSAEDLLQQLLPKGEKVIPLKSA